MKMTNEELIQALRICAGGAGCLTCCLQTKCDGIEDQLTTAAERLEALLTENEHLREATKMMPKWVSVEERLPAKPGEYIVHIRGAKTATTLEYVGCRPDYKGPIWRDDCDIRYKVTRWMPLPEPPRTEGVE